MSVPWNKSAYQYADELEGRIVRLRKDNQATIDALVAALEACIEDIKDSAQEIAENGGVKFDRDATWPEGSSIALAYAALALARGGK
ncbi:MAG: hypothetical protein E5Y73_11105 [Mesorhizobium sp.]|uniref:hypothetical protein n=1 Tax=Mesorhizobium sp. TaxID=1871066 RepID=UPI001220CC43|nr:hypothetical protein [Mesorhizobium sp.]TIL94650.1 MAG: hypothetical protein E5Y73_11105 [Mesorhizobium sp.]